MVVLAVLRFKQTLEARSLPTQYLNGQVVDPDSYHWLFNACREPHLGEDRLRKHERNDCIMVMRFGKFFKVSLKKDNKLGSFSALKSTFQEILDSLITEISWVSILTADERDRWAKVSY